MQPCDSHTSGGEVHVGLKTRKGGAMGRLDKVGEQFQEGASLLQVIGGDGGISKIERTRRRSIAKSPAFRIG